MRVLLALTASATVRLLREPLLVRALVWPAVLFALVPFLAMGLTTLLLRTPEIALPATGPVAAFEAAGFAVTVTDDPRAAWEADAVDRAAVRTDDGWALYATQGGWLRSSDAHRMDTLRAEALLRDHAGAGWRLTVGKLDRDEVLVPVGSSEGGPAPAPDALHDPLTALLGLVFTLYGVVVGVGSLSRDRAWLEASLSMGVPAWLHPLSLLLSSGATLGGAFVVTALFFRGMTPTFGAFTQEVAVGAVGCVEAAVLGLWVGTRRLGWVGPPAASVTSALTAALVLVTGLAGLGLSVPAVGRWLPVASVSAVALVSSPPAVVHALRATLLLGLASAAIGRRVRQ